MDIKKMHGNRRDKVLYGTLQQVSGAIGSAILLTLMTSEQKRLC